MYNGWIDDAYIKPYFHFTYQFFDWIQPFDRTTMYAIVAICGLSALCIGLGFLYRIATVIFFLSFTYLELIEKSWYLNHYYFVSLVAFLLILVPANRNYSIDSKLFPKIKSNFVYYWTILIIKLQLCCVYLFGGIAKIKSDWLFNAQPLKIWLKARTDIPILGQLFEYDITPYLFSWNGMLYDLTIPFLLFIRKTRPIAYVLVVVFHILTYILFNIGMFPWLMIFGSLIFISADFWKKLFKIETIINNIEKRKNTTLITSFFIIYVSLQILIPLRHHLLTNNLLWTENGLRFSWHVMIMEKNGFTQFTVIDNETGRRWTEYPSKHLSVIQEKQMSFQPDMIWQFAHYLKKEYKKKGVTDCSVYVNSKVSLNGRVSQTYINPKTDLASIKKVDDVYEFVTPMKE